jgi:hypothetical protein
VRSAVPRGASGDPEIDRCDDERGPIDPEMRQACSGFYEENTRRLAWALNPSVVCVDTGACTPSEADLANALDARWAREREEREGMMQILDGHVTFAAAMPTFKHMRDGFGDRSFRQRVQFPRAFRRVPRVHIGAAGVEVSGESALRFSADVESVDPYGFDLHIRTWGVTKLDRIRVGWVGFSRALEYRAVMTQGNFTLGASGGGRVEQKIRFENGFLDYPSVSLALRSVDSPVGQSAGVVARIEGITRDGFTAIFESLGAGAGQMHISWLASTSRSRATSGHITLDGNFPGFEVMDKRGKTNEFMVTVPLNRGEVRICRGVEEPSEDPLQRPRKKENTPVMAELQLLQTQTRAEPAAAPAPNEVLKEEIVRKEAQEDKRALKDDADGCVREEVAPVEFLFPPEVTLTISGFELRQGAAPNFEVEVVDVTTEEFTFRVFAAGNTVLRSISVGWLASQLPSDLRRAQEDRKDISMISALNSYHTVAHSCKDALSRKLSQGSGNYWVRLLGSQVPTLVFCDMNAGGWTRVVNIQPESVFHADRPEAYRVNDLSDPDRESKLSDGEISALNTVGYYRYECGEEYKAHVKTDGGGWSSELTNGLAWSLARRSESTDRLEFSCDATSPGNVFSEKNDPKPFCSEGHTMYAAPSAEVGKGCFHESWGKQGSLWAM